MGRVGRRFPGQVTASSSHLKTVLTLALSLARLVAMASLTGPNMSHVETLATMDAGWMLRGCQAYYDEMKACTSYRGRFHQYYVSGETADCSQWEENFADCELWVDRQGGSTQGDCQGKGET